MAVDTNRLNRRDLIRRAAAVLGVSALSPAIASAVMAGAGASDRAAAKPRYLSERQLELVATLAEMILPATNTPGARAADVHGYIDILLADYLSRAHRDAFMNGLAGVDAAAVEHDFTGFLEAPAEVRLEIAQALDQQGPDNSPFFYTLKELTLVGYYTSRVGATVELAYDPIPGQYRSCVAYEDLGRAWATK